MPRVAPDPRVRKRPAALAAAVCTWLTLALACGGRAADGDVVPSFESAGSLGAAGGRSGTSPNVARGGSGGSVAARPPSAGATGSAGGAGGRAPDPAPLMPPADDCPSLVDRLLEVRSQAELDALRGCRRLDGNVIILPFGDEDLTPLAALTTVRGTLVIGDPVSEPAPRGFASLSGLESLQAAGGLTLRGVRATTLQPLASLTEIGSRQGLALGTGYVHIEQCPELVDLAGLENVGRLLGFVARANPELTSVSSLQVPAALETFEVWDSPVADIRSLESLATVSHNLWFINTAIADVAPLRGVTDVAYIQFRANSALSDLSGLRSLSSVVELVIADNPSLGSVPELPNLSISSGVAVSGNVSLYEIGPLPAARGLYSADIFDNPSLARVAALAQVESASRVYVDRNAALVQLDLGRLAFVEDMLRVTHNPLLDSATVPRPSARGSIVIGGNRGEPLGLDPCPWPSNGYCEGPPSDDLCALGSDRDCAGGALP